MKRFRGLIFIIFIIYLLILFYFLIFSESLGRTDFSTAKSYNLIPFTEIKRFWNAKDELGLSASYLNIFGNVIIFIPFGLFLPIISSVKTNIINTFIFSITLSLAIEIMQYITKTGVFDVDDIILNTLGGIIGYLIIYIFTKRKRKSRR